MVCIVLTGLTSKSVLLTVLWTKPCEKAVVLASSSSPHPHPIIWCTFTYSASCSWRGGSDSPQAPVRCWDCRFRILSFFDVKKKVLSIFKKKKERRVEGREEGRNIEREEEKKDSIYKALSVTKQK